MFLSNIKRQASYLSCLLGTIALAAPLGDREITAAIPMEIDIRPRQAEVTVSQNFAMAVRIRNPNEFKVTLQGFELGYAEPRILVSRAHGSFERLPSGSIDDTKSGPPIEVPPGGFLETDRLLYREFSIGRWPAEAGDFLLRADCHVLALDLSNPTQHIAVQWNSVPVAIAVMEPSAEDREAMQFLVRRLQDHDDAGGSEAQESANLHRIRVFEEFLSKHEQAVYVAEIRWELSLLLWAVLENKQSPLHDDKRLVDLFEKSVVFCLDEGGAFAEPFLRWNLDKGEYGLMEFALSKQRTNLLRRVAIDLDARYPDDEQGRLYRQAIVLGAEGAFQEARAIATSLSERFPDSDVDRRVEQTLKYMERLRNAQ